MPNWCNNVATFHHTDPEQINRIIKAAKTETLLSDFFPCPTALCDTMAGSHGDPEEQNLLMIRERANRSQYGYKNWYEWCNNEWGTKWDVGCVEEAINRENPTTVSIGFDSAWSPPIAWYKKMETLGFEITAFYMETGVGYCGTFTDGEATDYDLNIKDEIPASLKDVFSFVFDNEETDEEN